MSREGRVLWSLVAVLLAALWFLPSPSVRAESKEVAHTDVHNIAHQVVVGASQVGYSNKFLAIRQNASSDVVAQGLGLSITQSVLVQGTGTSPNYKVEILCSMDGITFVKPEQGGDLGTFTDSNPHFIAVATPLSPGGHRLQFTEMGGANSITIEASEASQ